MFIADIARMIAGLAITLGLIGLIVVGLRRYWPETLKRLQGLGAQRRRLEVVQSLMLDPSRRLVLVRFDGQERLLLLGEGRQLPAQTTTLDPSEPAR